MRASTVTVLISVAIIGSAGAQTIAPTRNYQQGGLAAPPNVNPNLTLPPLGQSQAGSGVPKMPGAAAGPPALATIPQPGWGFEQKPLDRPPLAPNPAARNRLGPAKHDTTAWQELLPKDATDDLDLRSPVIPKGSDLPVDRSLPGLD